VDQRGCRPDQLIRRGESSLSTVATPSERDDLGDDDDSGVSSWNYVRSTTGVHCASTGAGCLQAIVDGDKESGQNGRSSEQRGRHTRGAPRAPSYQVVRSCCA
jgi:hypothetical protein